MGDEVFWRIVARCLEIVVEWIGRKAWQKLQPYALRKWAWFCSLPRLRQAVYSVVGGQTRGACGYGWGGSRP